MGPRAQVEHTQIAFLPFLCGEGVGGGGGCELSGVGRGRGAKGEVRGWRGGGGVCRVVGEGREGRGLGAGVERRGIFPAPKAGLGGAFAHARAYLLASPPM